MTLKKQLIRLGSDRPDLRKHLRPILASLRTGSGVYDYEDLDNAPPNWKGYDVSITYETWDEESLEIGETDDKGWYLEDDNYETLQDVVDSVRNYNWVNWSSSNPGPRDWISSEAEVDMRSGERTTYNLFIERDDGKPLSSEEISFISKKLRVR